MTEMTLFEKQMAESKKLEVEPGVFLAYEEHGSGDKYIICAQMSFGPRHYARKFADYGYHVFMIWDRGSGPSTHFEEKEGVTIEWGDIWAEDVIRFADKMGIDKFVYTGSSHGTGPGWKIAQKYPERLIAFIGLVTGVRTLAESKQSAFRIKARNNPDLDFLSDANCETDPALKRRHNLLYPYREQAKHYEIKGEYGSKDFPGITCDEDIFAPYRKIQVPMLLVGCTADQIIPPEQLLRAVQLIPKCKIIIYSGMSHVGPSMDYLEEVMPEYIHFLKAVEENEGRIYNKIIEEE